MPGYLTKEATAQDYFPEWILGPNVLADTAIFGRTFDQEQWKNAFGMSLIPARGADETQEALKLYRWFTGEEPPSNTPRRHQPEHPPSCSTGCTSPDRT